MHIPDGFLNVATAATAYAVSIGGVGAAIRRAGRKLEERQVPLIGILAAFIFAAQMLNFPVIGGTSGHLLGAALAAILLGPWAGVLAMSAVLIAQCLIFQDGGLLALGANVLNMALVGCLGGYAVYRLVGLITGRGGRGLALAAFAAAWASVVLSAVAAAVELALSGTAPLKVILPAMASVHAIIGIGEGLITAAVLGLVRVTRADLLPAKGGAR